MHLSLLEHFEKWDRENTFFEEETDFITTGKKVIISNMFTSFSS